MPQSTPWFFFKFSIRSNLQQYPDPCPWHCQATTLHPSDNRTKKHSSLIKGIFFLIIHLNMFYWVLLTCARLLMWSRGPGSHFPSLSFSSPACLFILQILSKDGFLLENTFCLKWLNCIPFASITLCQILFQIMSYRLWSKMWNLWIVFSWYTFFHKLSGDSFAWILKFAPK